MAIDARQVIQKAEAIVNTLARMTPKQKEEAPSYSFGQEFNKLFDLAKEADPSIDARLWPTPLGSGESEDMAPKTANARYVEIEAYARQVAILLDAGPTANAYH